MKFLPTKSYSTIVKPKIAFLWTVYDTINQPAIWKHFFDNADPSLYTIYIHQKTFKLLDPYFERYKVKTVPTGYGTMDFWRCLNYLLRLALQDDNNTRFVFISQACIPLKSFEYIYKDAMSMDKSWISECIPVQDRDTINPRKYICYDCSTDRYKHVVERGYPSEYMKKSSNWMMVIKKHAFLFVNDEKQIIDIYDDHQNIFWAPDEHIYISYLYYNHLEHEIQIREEPMTFTYWSGDIPNYPFQSNHSGLKNYDIISAEEISYLRHDTACWFARKFNASCSITL